MESELNQHLLHTLHFRPLLKDSFKQSGPEAFNSDGNYCIIDDTLSLTDKVNLEKFYKNLSSVKSNDKVYLDLEDKLKEMIKERENLSVSINNDLFLSKLFTDKFVKFLTDYTKSYLVALKLTDNTYKYITDVKHFEYIYKLYKLMFPEMKIDLEKSQFVKNKSTDEKLSEILENVKLMENFVDFNFDIKKSFVTEVTNIDIINNINQYNILTAEEIYNIPYIIDFSNKIDENVEKLNNLLDELNKLSSYKLNKVFLNTLSKQIKKPLSEDNTNLFFDKTISKEDLIYSKLRNDMYTKLDLNSDILSIKEKKDEYDNDEKNDYNGVLYNKYFNRLVVSDNLNLWNKNILPEFEMVKKLSNFEYSQLTKHFKEEIENYDESEKVSDMVLFIDRCLSQLTTKDKEEKVLLFMKEYFTFTNHLDDKMKFSDILSIMNDNFVEKVTTLQLADYLKKLGLAKKRYNDGIYWYGVKVNKMNNISEEDKENIFNILTEN
jgi:hypothetical protein